MAKYLLACTCGKVLVVEEKQAGGQARCDCGAVVEVPPLRKMRHLPPVPVETESKPATWSARNAVIAVALIVAMVFGGIAGFVWWTTPVLQRYDPELHAQDVRRSLNEMTPLGAWQQWIGYYSWLGDSGFSEFRPHNAAAIEAVRSRNLRYVQIAGAAAVVCLVIAIVVAAMSHRRHT